MPYQEGNLRHKQAALDYHENKRPGKIEVISSKPFFTQLDLSLAYTPGVAEPCREIVKDPANALRYTAKGNLVAVITNGTAVLGLGDIGPLAGKPVMEGKAVLFKRFADIDVFDIELDVKDPDAFIQTVRYMAPTFGGINLEDIKSPECFYIEDKLKEVLDIPVFHDDQHGTAIISGAALLNALELLGKQIDQVRVVFSGAGASALACASFYISLGVKAENILMADSKGVLWEGREDASDNPYKAKFFRKTEARTLEDAVKGSDVFCGLSVKGMLTKAMIKTMSDRPVIFALANPDPEISYDEAKEANPNGIVATGRSDYPNQVNNVLGFPFIFRGALDVQASAINEEMKLAAAHSLAALAKEKVPESVTRAYAEQSMEYGPEYIIPKPFDPRVLVWTAYAVAEAAVRSGVARKSIDLNAYKERLLEKIDWSREFMRKIHILARREKKRVVFPEGTHPKIIWAANEIALSGIAKPVLLAKDKKALLEEFEVLKQNPEGIEIVEPKKYHARDQFIKNYYKLRQRRGATQAAARLQMRNYFDFGAMMVREGHADTMVAGITANYPDLLRPALRIIGPQKGFKLIAGIYILRHEDKLYCFADCAVNINPSAEDLTEIATLAGQELERWNIAPRIAFLSFSNFGSAKSQETAKVTKAVEMLRNIRPEWEADGPMQADVATNLEYMNMHYPFVEYSERPNLFIFPNLDAGNISFKLLTKFANAHYIGPVLVGLAKPVQILTRMTEVNNIVNLTAIASVDASTGSFPIGS